jgi:hypothetical protein
MKIFERLRNFFVQQQGLKQIVTEESMAKIAQFDEQSKALVAAVKEELKKENDPTLQKAIDKYEQQSALLVVEWQKLKRLADSSERSNESLP